MVATNSIRLASGVALAIVVACGSQGEGEGFRGLGGDFGFVGSGGGGSGYGYDGGGETGGQKGALDGGGADGAFVGSGADAGFAGDDGGTSGSGGDDGGSVVGNTGDGGSTVVVAFDLPAGFFASLDWVISGPSGYYSGTIELGDAHSIEFVKGGIQAGSGYTMTLAGKDRYGAPCGGTSAPFAVVAGQVSAAGVLLTCDQPVGDASQPAYVTTGSVGVEAGVVLNDP